MEYALQQTLNALSIGGEYALLALGLAIIFSVMGLVNFAHGELIALGGYAMYFTMLFAGPPVALLIPICVIAAMLAAVAFDQVAFKPVRNAPPTTGLLTAFGVSIIIQNILVIFVATRARPVPTPDWMRGNIMMGNISVPVLQLLEFVVTCLALAGLLLLLNRTNMGLAMRAAARDFVAVRMMGIRANRVIMTAFAVSGALAGIAAVFIISRRGAVDPFMGFIPLLKAFVACVLGGFGSLLGALVGGLVLGCLEVFLQSVLPSHIAGYRDAFVFLLVGMVLVLKPEGLVGKRVELGDKDQ